MAKKHNKAFTLVELLVVISVIGLLMAILLPSLGAAREQGRKVVCASNLRNLGVALRIYIDDNGGGLPSAEPFPGHYGTKEQNWFMNESLLACMGVQLQKDNDGELIGPPPERTILTCPSHREPAMTRDNPPFYPCEERAYALSYMANGTWGVSGKGNTPYEYRYISEFSKPSETLALCDGDGTRQAPATVLYCCCPKPNFAFRHRGSANVLFLDSHTKLLKEEDIPFCSRFDDLRFGTFWATKRNRR